MASSTPGYSKFIDEDDPIFNPSRAGKRQGLESVDEFGEVFGGKAKFSSTPDIGRRGEDFDFENMFGAPPADAKGSGPVFDKPLYDDDDDDDGEESVFAGLQQMKGSGPANLENVFAGSGSNPFDDLLVGVNAGGVMGSTKSFNNIDASSVANGVSNFDDLLPGFGGSSPASASGSLPPYEEYVPSYRHSPSTTTLHNIESPDEIWFTVSEIPLFTQPTSAPPPSRPPPPIPATAWKMDTGAKSRRTNVTDFSSFYKSTQNSQTFKSGPAATRSSANEVEDFAKGNTYDHSSAHTGFDEDWLAQSDAAASAAAMKEAMNRAEVKFRQAKELKERENAKGCRNKENSTARYNGENLDREQKIKEEDELEKKRFEQERKKARELEQENDRVQRRLEIEREKAREETEQAKHAVQRATREARERAAADALLRAEKAAANKANSEARERAERLAVQRAQAESRERAAAEAKEKAERAAAEAKARSNAEAKERAAKAGIEARTRAERVAVDRASKEARERASAHARERVAAQARERAADTRASQQKPEDDFDSFFSSGSRPSSAPRATANNSDFSFSPQFQTKQGSEAAWGTSSGSPSIRKVSSTTNFVDDLSSIFGGSPQSRSFQEVEGETEERSRARLERYHRTNERATKAVAEMNERDLQAQREQAERQRFSETLDAEIKRWAAGKQGNLRALLSTMQYILWPESGWQPVSLSDLISGASVKKVYRKATLCVHPDKVQQKGANLQQKYIAEKVFDLLKEAWNKFNSEELF